MLFDTHAHLESPRFEGDIGGAIERARAVGVTRIITCGSDAQTSAACVNIAQEYTGVYAAAGVHPHEARTLCDESGGLDVHLCDSFFKQTREWARDHAIVAIGEWPGTTMTFTESSAAQSGGTHMLTCELGLPVIMHNRESDSDSELAGTGPERAARCLALLYGRARTRRLGALARLLSWTRGPYHLQEHGGAGRDSEAGPPGPPLDRDGLALHGAAPASRYPQRACPVRFVAQRLADIRGMELQELARHTTENARRLFGVA